MGATSVIAGNDLKRRLRNRSALVTAFIGPVVLASIISAALGGSTGFSATIAVVDADGSTVSTAYVQGLLSAGSGSPVTFTQVSTTDDARQQVEAGKVSAAVVIPTGFGASIAGPPSQVPERLLVLRNASLTLSGDVAAAVAQGFATRVDAVRLALASAAAAAAQRGQAVDLAAVAGAAEQVTRESVLTVTDTSPGGQSMSAAAYFGPAMAILFLFFTLSLGARSLITDRKEGILPRLLAAPVAPAAIVAGKTISVFVLGYVGMLMVWGVTAVIFGASWGDPLAVIVLCGFTVFAIAGISTLVTTLARTDEQADTYTSAVAFTLALIGGNFVRPDPDTVMGKLALLTPNGWSLEAFSRLAADGVGLAGIVGPLAILTGFGLVFGAIGLRRVGRLVTLA